MWTQQAYIKPPNTERLFEDFGTAVTLDGDKMVVGERWGFDGANSTGLAYLFTRDASGAWTEQASLRGFNTDQGAAFGSAVALGGGTLVVGATRQESVGAAYVFALGGPQLWEQQAYVRANNRDLGDEFGVAVASDADTLVVGAHWEVVRPRVLKVIRQITVLRTLAPSTYFDDERPLVADSCPLADANSP